MLRFFKTQCTTIQYAAGVEEPIGVFTCLRKQHLVILGWLRFLQNLAQFLSCGCRIAVWYKLSQQSLRKIESGNLN